MNLHDLLNRRFACACGREHAVPVRRFEYRPSVIDELGDLLCCAVLPVRAWLLGILSNAAGETLDQWLMD